VSQLLGVAENSTASARRFAQLMDLADPRHLGDFLFPPLGLLRHWGDFSQGVIDAYHKDGDVPGGVGGVAGTILDTVQTDGLGRVSGLLGQDANSSAGAYLDGLPTRVGNLEDKLPSWMNVHQRRRPGGDDRHLIRSSEILS
jgi:hypothetical protein